MNTSKISQMEILEPENETKVIHKNYFDDGRLRSIMQVAFRSKGKKRFILILF